MVWPSRVRRRQRKHAFEQALDEARLDPDGDPLLSDDEDGPGLGPQRAVGSFGDIAVAAGYVAQSSLRRAYGDDGDGDAPQSVLVPAEAAQKLKAELAARAYTAKELTRMRRTFAAANHPDRVPSERRDEAVLAMSEVNAAIDIAIKRVETS